MPVPDNWKPFDDELKDQVRWEQLKMRLNRKPRKVGRVQTGIAQLDDVLGGGIPNGLNVIYGPAGAGKSMFSKTICNSFVNRNKKILYFYGEDSFDAPEPRPPYINTIDMVAYRPGPQKSVATMLKAIQEMKPDLAVIDSLTTILGGTSKAVQEADVREFTGQLAKRVSGIIPVIGISEIRGSGKYEGPAGGRGVLHAGLSVFYFGKVFIDDKWKVQDYGGEVGDLLWYFQVEKDRDGLAKQGRVFQLTYMGDEMYFNRIAGGME